MLNKRLSSDKFPGIVVKGQKQVIAEKDNKKVRKTIQLPLLSQSSPVTKRGLGVGGSSNRVYKYKYYPGNNGRVILNSFRKRPWWFSCGNNNKSTDNAKETVNYDIVWEMYRNPKRYKEKSHCNVTLNHLENNSCLVSKKGLYLSLKAFSLKSNINILDVIPRTFYISPTDLISEGKGDLEAFLNYNNEFSQKISVTCSSEVASTSTDDEDTKLRITPSTPEDDSQGIIWILKPASYANRGFGIKVVRGIEAVMNVVESESRSSTRSSTRSKEGSSSPSAALLSSPKRRDLINTSSSAINLNYISHPSNSTAASYIVDQEEKLTKAAKRCASKNGWIVQEYMTDPLLVSGRKFDIRCFVLIMNTCKDGFKGYFFRDGYIRTSCKKYSLSKLSDRETHLTNDAVQKHAKSYGKFEAGNKLTYAEWQEVIDKDYPSAPRGVVHNCILPKIRDLIKISLAAASESISKTQIHRSFELLGYDFMVDSRFNPTLIEINSNPCLEFACPLLEDLISSLIDNMFKVTVDSFFPPPAPGSRTRTCEEAVQLIDQEPDLFDLVFESK